MTLQKISFVVGCALLAACTGSKSEKAPDATSAVPHRQGTQTIPFDYLQASELLLAKADPLSGDTWTARFVKGHGPENDDWRIASGPNGKPLDDDKANGGFILHLLDTARTIAFADVLVSGPPESFGLANPLFLIRWKVGGQDFEIRLGAPAKNSDGSFTGLYASYKGKTVLVQGAFLKMLERVTSFEALRLQTLSTFRTDDVDEVEVRSPQHNKVLFFAQRDGDRWTNKARKPVQADVTAFLDEVTHIRILKFFDDAASARKLATLPAEHPVYVVTFKNRRGDATSLRLAARGAETLATLSSRKNTEGRLSVFQVYPQILSAVSILLR